MLVDLSLTIYNRRIESKRPDSSVRSGQMKQQWAHPRRAEKLQWVSFGVWCGRKATVLTRYGSLIGQVGDGCAEWGGTSDRERSVLGFWIAPGAFHVTTILPQDAVLP